LGAVENLAAGFSLVILPANLQSAAVDLMLFGFIASIGIAMSPQLFPLTFRTQLPTPAACGLPPSYLATE